MYSDAHVHRQAAAIRSRPLPVHQIRRAFSPGTENLAPPVRLESRNHFRHFVFVGGYDRVVARFGEVLGLSVERF